jgi:quinoprotein glucose dehydrogenase
MDQYLRAMDMRTGEELWKDRLPAGSQTTPMTYSVDGRQHVLIATGGHLWFQTPAGDEIVAYALGRVR